MRDIRILVDASMFGAFSMEVVWRSRRLGTAAATGVGFRHLDRTCWNGRHGKYRNEDGLVRISRKDSVVEDARVYAMTRRASWIGRRFL